MKTLRRIHVYLLVLLYWIFILILNISLNKPSVYSLLYLLLISISPLIFYYLILKYFTEEIPYVTFLYFCGLSLLLSYSTVGILNGNDIYGEWYYSNFIINHKHWDYTMSSFSYNFVLPVVMLYPLTSELSGVSLISILKFVPNLIFSFSFVILFRLYTKALPTVESFYTVLYILSFPAIWYILPTVTRQEFAMFFIILYIYVLFVKPNNNLKKIAVGLALLFAAVTSHYATSIIYIFVWILSLIILLVIYKLNNSKMLHINKVKSTIRKLEFTILLSLVLWVLWYGMLSTSHPFVISINIFTKYIASLRDPLSLFSQSGTGYVLKTTNQFYNILPNPWKFSIWAHFFTLVLVGIGMLKYSIRAYSTPLELEPNKLFYILSGTISFAVPIIGLAGSLGILRTTIITMPTWAPFFIVGLTSVVSKIPIKNKKFLILTSIVLLFLVNTHIISYLFLGVSDNPAISWRYPSPKTWTTSGEYYGALYLRTHSTGGLDVVPGSSSSYPRVFAISTQQLIDLRKWSCRYGCYIYFDEEPVRKNILTLPIWTSSGLVYLKVYFRESSMYRNCITSYNKIYTSTAWILILPKK